jgi:hypothetical protein
MSPRGEAAEVDCRPWRPTDTEQIAAVLAACGLKDCADPEGWRWKHERHAGFDPRNVLVFTAGDRIVACTHATPLPMRLQGRARVLISVDGDYGVLPEMRGGGLIRRAYQVSNAYLRPRGVVLRGGFTSIELYSRFYRTKFGSTRIAQGTRPYIRFLRPDVVQARVDRARARRGAAPGGAWRRLVGLSVEVALRGMPPFTIHVDPDGPRLWAGPDAAATVHVEGPAALLHLFAGGGPRVRHMLRAIGRGRVRVRGWWRRPVALLRLLVELMRSS